MFIGTCKLTIRLPENLDLKGKRRIVKSLCSKLRNQFDIAIAEVGSLDLWQIAELGLAYVSNDKKHAESVLSNIIEYIHDELHGDFELIDHKIEILSNGK